MDITFGEWLQKQIDRKGWNQTRLAKSSGLTRQAINNYVSNRVLKPDEIALANIARALEIPVETVYEAAGIPTTRLSQRDATLRELDLLFDSASPEQRDEIIRYARYILSEYNPRPLTKPSPSET
jgi:transcriptional regulator with XRE-family HTH domain